MNTKQIMFEEYVEVCKASFQSSSKSSILVLRFFEELMDMDKEKFEGSAQMEAYSRLESQAEFEKMMKNFRIITKQHMEHEKLIKSEEIEDASMDYWIDYNHNGKKNKLYKYEDWCGEDMSCGCQKCVDSDWWKTDYYKNR